MFLKKNTSSQTIGFCLVNASSGAALIGATVSVRRCIDGTFAATTGTVTEDSGGLYKFAPSQADTNGDQVAYYFTATSAIPVCLNVRTTAADMSDTVRFGLTALPNTAVTTNASLLTSGTGTDQISVSSGKVLLQATQTGVTIPTVTTVTNQLTAAQVATGVWQDTTAGDFTVASSIGKSLYTSGAVPGAAGGLFIAGTNAATTITTALTTTFTGSLTGSVASVSGAVGSVTGAVGSVTGSVGGNVTGSVGSVAAAVTLSAADGQAWATGTATAGGATSITLQTALGADSLAVGSLIKITSGAGAGQTRVITAYVDGTKVVTVDRAWAVNAASGSVYAIVYADAPKLDSSLKISGVVLADTITTYTGDTPQTGDSFARIGSTGSGLTSLAPSATALSTATWSGTLATNLTTLASHDPGTTLGTSTLTAAGVWDLATSGHTTSGTFGAAAVAAGGAGDPWSTSLPGSYGAGTAGYIIGNNVNATISSRQATFTAGTSISFPTNFGSLAITAGGVVSADLQTIKTQTVTCAAGVTVLASVGTATTDTAQTGDSFARIGATGSGLTSLAPSSTALSTAQWSNTRAGYLDNLSAGAVALASGVAVTSIGAGVITATSIAADAITAAKIADGAIDTATFAAGTTIPRVTLADTATTLTNLPAVTTDWLTAAGVSAAGAAKIADVTLRRTMAHVFASSDGDAVTKNSLYGSIQQMQKSSIGGTTMTILNTDGSTLGTFTVTVTAGADPITAVA